MKRTIATFFILMSLGFTALASGNLKTTSLKGNVTDNQGEPLAGVKVYVPSLEKSVYTDFDGNFQIQNVPLKEQTLKLSYISHNAEEVKLDPTDLNSSLHLQLRSR